MNKAYLQISQFGNNEVVMHIRLTMPTNNLDEEYVIAVSIEADGLCNAMKAPLQNATKEKVGIADDAFWNDFEIDDASNALNENAIQDANFWDQVESLAKASLEEQAEEIRNEENHQLFLRSVSGN